ncbi:hypothetical protein AJ87_36665 [Rhizobium yanglingense]|nr:hypothetical protein AJ87_36665 [Rhizobium yanglingense]
MLYLQTFGDLRLTDANGNAIRYPAKGLVMVAYLFSRKTHELSRHELSEFLWADAEAELSGLNLRKLISRIRQIDDDTNAGLLQITSSSIRLRTEALAVDLQALDSAMPPLARLRAISDLLQRDFMASVKPSTRSIDNWITGERGIID